jgi:hypothetical protein
MLLCAAFVTYTYDKGDLKNQHEAASVMLVYMKAEMLVVVFLLCELLLKLLKNNYFI